MSDHALLTRTRHVASIMALTCDHNVVKTNTHSTTMVKVVAIQAVVALAAIATIATEIIILEAVMVTETMGTELEILPQIISIKISIQKIMP
jgi:hypothetical protein